MADQSNIVPPSGANNQSSTKEPKQSLSPWEEDLPEEPSKEQKIGGFTNNKTSLSNESSFVVPQNIENSTALNMVDGANLDGVKNNPSSVDSIGNVGRNGSMDLDLTGSSSSFTEPVLPQSQPVVDSVPSKSSMAAQPVVSSQVVPNQTQTVPTAVANDNFDDLDLFGPDNSTSKTIATDIKPASISSPVAPVSPSVQTASVASASPSIEPVTNPIQSSIVPNAPDAPTSEAVVPNSAPVLPEEPLVTSSQDQNTTDSAIDQTQEKKKKNYLSKAFSIFNKKEQDTAKVAENIDQSALTSTTTQVPVSEKDSEFSQPASKRRFVLPLAITFGIILIFAVLVMLTETGVISIGLEKIYNAAGLEVLWGGLPKDAEKSIGRSLVAMKSQTSFSISGNISVNIDKTVNSPITTPLVALLQEDNSVITYKLPVQKAILADTASNAISPSTVTDQQSISSYQSLQSNTKDMTAVVNGQFSTDGNEVTFLVDKAGTSVINLKNNGENLWVKSNKIKFNSNAVIDKWLQYDLKPLSGQDLLSGFNSSDFGKASVKGEKVGDEKIGDVSCYKYQIDSLDIGNAFSGIGVNSDMVSSVSGNVWIGISDKLIRKIDLNITPSVNSSVSLIHLTLELSGFSDPSTYTALSSNDIIKTVSNTTTF